MGLTKRPAYYKGNNDTRMGSNYSVSIKSPSYARQKSNV